MTMKNNAIIKILHLEDENSDAELIVRQLHKDCLEHERLLVNNRECYQKGLEEFSPDIILADHDLPGFSSIEALQLCKKKCRHIPFILVSGQISEEYAAEIVRDGAYDYIHKDKLSRLTPAIKHAIERSRLLAERQKYLENVIESEAMLKQTESLAHIGSWQTELVSGITKWSDEAFKLYGYEPNEKPASFELFLNHIHPEDLGLVKEMTSTESLAMHNSIKFDLRIIDKYGKIKYISNHLQIQKDDEGKPVKINGFTLDITDNVRAGLEIKKRERFYKALIEKNTDTVTMVDADGIILFGSPSILQQFGYQPEEFTGKSVLELVYEKDKPAFKKLISNVLSRPSEAVPAELRILHKNEGYRWCKGTFTNLLHDTDIKGLILNLRDITEKKEQQLKITQSENRYQKLFDNNPIPAWIFEIETLRFLAVNEAAKLHYGYTAEEFLSMKVSDIKPKDDLEYFISILQIPGTYTTRHVLKNGKEITVELKSAEVDFDGKKARLVVCNDISERLIAEEQLIRIQSHLLASQKIGNIGSWELVFDGNELLINYLSDQAYRILGHEPGSGIKNRDEFLSGVVPEDRFLLDLAIKKAIKTKTNYKVEYRIIRPDGIERMVKSSGEIIFDSLTDKPVKMIGTILDITGIKKSDEALVKSEANIRTIFENTDIAYVLLDCDLKIISFNNVLRQYAEFFLDVSFNEGDEFLSLVHPDRRSETSKNLILVLNGKTIQYEKNYAETGKSLWYDIKFSPIENKGKTYGILISIKDITDMKIKAEKLSQSEAHLSASQRIGNVGSWELILSDDGEANFGKTYWSAQTYRIFGYEPYEIDITTDFFIDRVHPDDRDRVVNSTREAIKSNTIYESVHRIIKKDGEVRVVQNKAQIIRDPVSKRALKMIGAIQDISEMKLAQEALIKSEANLSSIVNNTAVAYVLLDDSLNIVFFNEPARMGWLQELGKDIRAGTNAIEYFTGERKSKLIENCNRVLNQGVNINYESSFKDESADIYWYYNLLTPVTGSDHRILGMIMARTDITERKQSEIDREKITEDLIQRNKDLEQFTYIVSHNLRAPVANIIGTSALLIDNNIEKHEQTFLMEGLLASVNRLDEVIFDLNNILQVKKAMNEKKEAIVFSDLVHDIKSSIAEMISNSNAAITTDFSECDEFISIRSYMYSIFYNLVTNSIKYRKPTQKPEIEIYTRKNKNELLVIFKDNGIGFNIQKYNEQIFGLYKRFHLHIEGKGLGLFMVKTQVESLGGTIRLKSAENEGSEFTLHFKI
jgi:PAS domain S-box-containing protein